jgi:branched-chain amino acid transport system permease protein
VKDLARRRSVGLAVAAIAAAAVLPLVAGAHLLTAMIVALHAAYMALAWNIAAGYAGQFSLGHSLFFGIGAYASTVLFVRLGLTPWVGMFAGAALAGLAGTVLALVVYRYNVRGIFFALVTLGAAEVGKGLADNWDFIKGPVGILLTMQEAPGSFLFPPCARTSRRRRRRGSTPTGARRRRSRSRPR